MKKYNILLASALVVLLMFSCTANFEDINTNPNKTTVGQVKATSIFEPLLYNGANAWLNYTHFWNNELIQFTAFTGGTTRQEHRYFISDGNWQTVWNLYARYANNVMHMYDLSVQDEDKSLEAVALTLKVLWMYNLTDIYGDIPYSEAFTARKAGGTSTPVFESQKEVYELMFADLEQANEIYATKPVFLKPALDGMYNGSMDQWRKFNNSLYLRLLMRVSGRSEMNSGSKIKEIMDNPSKYPIFESNNDNATVNFSGIDPYRNQFADTNESAFTSSGRKITEQVIKMTVVEENGEQVYVDPRLPIIAKKNPSTVTNPNNRWIGTIAGVKEEEQSVADRGTSWLNTPVFCRADAPGWFMDYAEVQFIFAEAALKGMIPGGEAQAKEYYTNAVTASLEKWGEYGEYSETPVAMTSAQINQFLSSDLASWDNASNKEELIGNQKYLALFWIGMEAYHEYRRTEYPKLTIGNGAFYNDYILPTRFGYPRTTMATNNEHAKEALTRMGGENDMKTPVWWSKKAINK